MEQDIYTLIDRFDKSTALSMKVSTQKFTLELSRAGSASVPAAAVQAVDTPDQPEAPVVTAPLVGTFYVASAPDQPSYVSVGDVVKEGQTMCLLEAMKMMSEIPAPCDLVVEEVLKENGELAAYGEPLFRYRPC